MTTTTDAIAEALANLKAAKVELVKANDALDRFESLMEDQGVSASPQVTTAIQDRLRRKRQTEADAVLFYTAIIDGARATAVCGSER